MSDTPIGTPAPAPSASSEIPQRQAPQRKERDFSSTREASTELANKRRSEARTLPDAQPIEYRDAKGRTAPKSQTIDLNRGSDDLKKTRITDASTKEILDRDALAREVDEFRARNGAPTDPTHRDPTQIDPSLFGDPKSHLQPQIDPAHLTQDLRQPQQRTTPGVDQEVERAMAHPQVRQAMEHEFGKAFELQERHAKQINLANDFAQAAFRSSVPELANLRPEQIVPFLNQMAKTNPPRFKAAMALLDNVAKANTARQQIERQRAHAERQEFQRYAQEQDRAYERMVGAKTPQQMKEFSSEMVAYAGSMGIDQKTLQQVLSTNPIARHSAFQKMVHDAVQGRLAQKQLAEMRQQNRAKLPPVQAPGIASQSGVRQAQNSQLQGLRDRLNRSGDIKDAAALLAASRRKR
jgi:hypothetical protein